MNLNGYVKCIESRFDARSWTVSIDLAVFYEHFFYLLLSYFLIPSGLIIDRFLPRKVLLTALAIAL